MILTNCYPSERLADVGDVGDYELSRRIRVALCCHYYLAYAVKQGVPRSKIRDDEARLRDDLHAFFAAFSALEMKWSIRSRCDVCGVVELVRRMALSQYAQECRDFIVQTQDNEDARAEYDWTKALQLFSESAALKRESWLGRQVTKAVPIMHFIQTHVPKPVVLISEEPTAVASGLSECLSVGALLKLAREQIYTIRSQQLRVIQ